MTKKNDVEPWVKVSFSRDGEPILNGSGEMNAEQFDWAASILRNEATLTREKKQKNCRHIWREGTQSLVHFRECKKCHRVEAE